MTPEIQALLAGLNAVDEALAPERPKETVCGECGQWYPDDGRGCPDCRLEDVHP